jgi:hypothetical protein
LLFVWLDENSLDHNMLIKEGLEQNVTSMSLTNE